MTTEQHQEILRTEGLSKFFPGVKALDNVDFSLRRGEIMALLGENGAGKSTLIKSLTGVYHADRGTIWLEGNAISPKNTAHAQQLGIGTVYQEVNLLPNMSVADNLFIGREPRRFGLLRRKEMEARATALMASYGFSLDVREPLNRFSVAMQQIVAICRAIDLSAKVLILDEPTVGLDPTQLMEVRNLILDLRRNHAIILSSHILGEISAVCDRIVIINHGEIKADDTIERLEEADDSGLVVKLKVQGSSREVPKVARSVDGVVRVDNIQFVQTGVYTYDVELENDGVRNALLSALLQHGLEVLEISTEKKNLEQVFVKLVNQKTKHSSLEDLLQEMDDEAAQEPAAQPAEDKPAADAPAEDAAGTDGKKED